jgi:hypothetical protein
MVEAARGLNENAHHFNDFLLGFLPFEPVPLKNPEKTLVQVFFSQIAEPFWFSKLCCIPVPTR